jgi:hypothetical protein
MFTVTDEHIARALSLVPQLSGLKVSRYEVTGCDDYDVRGFASLTWDQSHEPLRIVVSWPNEQLAEKPGPERCLARILAHLEDLGKRAGEDPSSYRSRYEERLADVQRFLSGTPRFYD